MGYKVYNTLRQPDTQQGLVRPEEFDFALLPGPVFVEVLLALPPHLQEQIARGHCLRDRGLESLSFVRNHEPATVSVTLIDMSRPSEMTIGLPQAIASSTFIGVLIL